MEFISDNKQKNRENGATNADTIMHKKGRYDQSKHYTKQIKEICIIIIIIITIIVIIIIDIIAAAVAIWEKQRQDYEQMFIVGCYTSNELFSLCFDSCRITKNGPKRKKKTIKNC